jgi:hypothetical protein
VQGFTINIGWEYFLGIMFAMIGIAWYSSSRFTALETSMDWVKGILNELKISSDNTTTPAFGSNSPIELNETGEKWIIESGMKEYLDANKETIMAKCTDKKETNPYEVQNHIFRLFSTLEFDSVFDDKLKKFAFEKGISMNILRRVSALYFRRLCLKEFGMNTADIDRHDPAKNIDS